jgi:hypothetical protein
MESEGGENILEHSVCTDQYTHFVSFIKTTLLNGVMENNLCLFGYTYKNITALCGQNAVLLNVKPDVRKVKTKPQRILMKLLFISR